MVQVSFNLTPPLNIHYVFGDWLHRVDRKLKNIILFGTCTLCWAIWLSINDEVFNNTRVVTPMQVIFMSTYWIRFWLLLQKGGRPIPNK